MKVLVKGRFLLVCLIVFVSVEALPNYKTSELIQEKPLNTTDPPSTGKTGKNGVVPRTVPRKGVSAEPDPEAAKRNQTWSEPDKTEKVKKFKPKPIVTIGDADDVEKPIVHGSPTKSPPLGMSSKLKYVFPVMMTILVIPLLIVGFMCIYKNGRDCWDKRHYRRMDFLIDGMYNE